MSDRNDTSWQGQPKYEPTETMVAAMKLARETGEHIIICHARVEGEQEKRMRGTLSGAVAFYMRQGLGYGEAHERVARERGPGAGLRDVDGRGTVVRR
jgi:hypothetical protein